MEAERARVTVVIPANDEGASVAAVVAAARDALHRAGYGCEVLVVDDGSRDDTADNARAAGARVISSSRRAGYGAALKRGLRAANGDIVAVLDGDGTYPAGEIPELVAAVENGAHQAVGARTVAGAAVPLARRPAKWMVRRLAEVLTGAEIPDLNSGLRCFRPPAVEGYLPFLPDGFSFTTSVTVAALLDRQELVWRPVDYRQRVGRSKFRALRDTCNLLLALVRAVVYFRPLRVFGSFAAVCAAAATGTAAWDVLVERNIGDTTVLLAVATLQLFALGLLADLLVKRSVSRR